MHGGSGGSGKRARIEIIPLIDIIFFLLATFIMVSLSMTKNQGPKLPLPNAATAGSIGDQAELDRAVTLSVNEKGELFFNKEKMSATQLSQKLKAAKAAVPPGRELKVVINSDASSPYRGVSVLLEELRRLGVSKVSFSTEKK